MKSSHRSLALASALAALGFVTPARAQVSRAATLCRQGDEAQFNNDLPAARQRLEAGLAALGTANTAAAQGQRLLCESVLSQVLAAQGDRRASWAHMVAAWTAARALPPARWAGFEPAFFEQSARLWDGAGCVAGLDGGAAEEAEGIVLQTLARRDTPGLRACLTAVRARVAQEQRGICRVVRERPSDVPAFSAGERSWTAVNGQLGVRGVDGGVMIAQVNEGGVRYVRCEANFTEGQVTAAGAWVTPGALLAVQATILPCGENSSARCPQERLVYLLDGSLRLVGFYDFQRSSGLDRGPLAMPFGPQPGLAAITASGAGVQIGTRRLTLSQQSLAAAP